MPRSRLSMTLQPNAVILPFLVPVLPILQVQPRHLLLHHQLITNIHLRHHLRLCLLPRMAVLRTLERVVRVKLVLRLDTPACAVHSGDTVEMTSTILQCMLSGWNRSRLRYNRQWNSSKSNSTDWISPHWQSRITH